MTDLFGIPIQALLGQLLLGLVNGSFYAMLSLGLAVIFGLLNVINFAHGALYMLGAFVAWMGLSYLGLNYWIMLILAPLVVGLFGILIEKLLLRHLYKLDHLYGLLLTFGLTLLIEGLFRSFYGVSGQPYPTPESCAAPPTWGSWCCRTTAPGRRGLDHRVPGNLVRHRTHPPGRAAARRHRESAAGGSLRRQRAAHDHADLRLRRRAGRLRRRAAPRRCCRFPR